MSKVLLDIDNDMVMSAVKTQVSEAISENMGGINKLTSQLIEYALTTKVNSQGVVSKYNSENNTPLIDQMVLKHIRETAKDLIAEHFEETKDDLRKELKRQLATKKTQTGLLEALMNTLNDSVKCKYNHTVNIEVNK